jgi:asparagine synthase (glutamine-hydrolysing)
VGDSELILAAYRKWGAECARHLLGDFAFAVWDGKKQELFCARDHVGVKPLYFFRSDEMFAFATEMKALLELPGVPREVNEERIAKYLMVAYDSHADTMFAHIERLPPAHTLRTSARGVEIRRYWDLRDAPDLSGLSEREAVGEIPRGSVRGRTLSPARVANFWGP